MATNGVMNKVNTYCGTSCRVVQCWKWDVEDIILRRSRKNANYAVLILNRNITQSQEFIKEFWNNAAVRITVDGGTVQWDQFLEKIPKDEQINLKLPDLITGDFDSITDDVLQKYREKGCKVVHTPDQNLTDFSKAMIQLGKHIDVHCIELENIFAVGQCSGRIDQIFGNVQSMFLTYELHIFKPNTHLFLISDDAMTWILGPGDHIIIVPEDVKNNSTAWCSLIPVGEMCQNIMTSGLKWNLSNEILKFGELISTSNTFDGSDKVKIKCSNTLLWSMKIPRLWDQ